MREAGDGKRLLLEPPQPVGIVPESRGEHLDRDLPLQPRIVGTIDRTHPAGPEQLAHGEMVDTSTDGDGHVGPGFFASGLRF